MDQELELLKCSLVILGNKLLSHTRGSGKRQLCNNFSIIAFCMLGAAPFAGRSRHDIHGLKYF